MNIPFDEIDEAIPFELWVHPKDSATTDETRNIDRNLNFVVDLYTDGSKDQEKVGAVFAVFERRQLVHSRKSRMGLIVQIIKRNYSQY